MAKECSGLRQLGWPLAGRQQGRGTRVCPPTPCHCKEPYMHGKEGANATHQQGQWGLILNFRPAGYCKMKVVVIY